MGAATRITVARRRIRPPRSRLRHHFGGNHFAGNQLKATDPVSYTHLDVYKRQVEDRSDGDAPMRTLLLDGEEADMRLRCV